MGTGVSVGGGGVGLGGAGVSVGGTGVGLGGTGVSVAGTGVGLGGTGVSVGCDGVEDGRTATFVGWGAGVGPPQTVSPAVTTPKMASQITVLTISLTFITEPLGEMIRLEIERRAFDTRLSIICEKP